MTLEETRGEIRRVKKNRKRATLACLGVMVMAAAAGAWAVSNIMPLRGQWEYENRREYKALDTVTEPSYLYVVIKYEGEAPGGIEIAGENGIRVRRMDVDQDAEAKTMAIGADIGPDEVPQAYVLSLVPGDNYELQYSVEIQPSYRHMISSAEFYTDADGNLWFSCSASYKRNLDERGIRATLRFDGVGYSPSGYDGWIRDGDGICVNVTEAAVWKRIDLDKAVSAELTLQASYEDPEDGTVEFVNEKYRVRLREWPAYKPDGGQDYAMDATWDYIRGLNLRPPEGRELPPEPETEPAEGAAPEDGDATEIAQEE